MMIETMNKLAGAGISFLPTGSDKLPDFNLLPIVLNEYGNSTLNKHGNPVHEWTRFQREIPSAQWIRKWRNAWGIAIIGGKVSGNLYCMDFEAKDHKHGPMESIYPEWEKLVKAELIRLGYPELFAQFPITKRMRSWLLPGRVILMTENRLLIASSKLKRRADMPSVLHRLDMRWSKAIIPDPPPFLSIYTKRWFQLEYLSTPQWRFPMSQPTKYSLEILGFVPLASYCREMTIISGAITTRF